MYFIKELCLVQFVYSDLKGEPLQDVTFPVHSVSQVTALAWHPDRRILVTGWENGEIKVWNGNDKEFLNVTGPHKTPVILIEFSEKGGRLVSCDSVNNATFIINTNVLCIFNYRRVL